MPSSFAISTGTVCPFPMIWPSSSTSSHNGSDAAQCTQTYAERLGGPYLALQTICILVPAIVLAVLCVQLAALRRQAAHKQRQNSVARPRIWHHASFSFIFCAVNYNAWLLLYSVDLFNFHGWYNIHASAIINEIVGGVFTAVAVVLVDFWVRCAKFNSRHGLPPRQLALFVLLPVCNFGFWLTAGMLHPTMFVAYKVVKLFCAALILIFFLIRAHVSVRELQDVLLQSSLRGGERQRATTSNKTEESDGQQQPTRDKTKTAVAVLTRKFHQLAAVLVIAIVVLTVNGLVSLVTAIRMEEWHWQVPFFDQLDAMQCVLRGVHLLGAVVCLTFFRTPRESKPKALTATTGFTVVGSGGGMSPLQAKNNSKLVLVSAAATSAQE